MKTNLLLAALLFSHTTLATNVIVPEHFNKETISSETGLMVTDQFLIKASRIIFTENERLKKVRSKLETISNKDELSENDNVFLNDLFSKYLVEDKSVESLLEKVDVVPTGLILAHSLVYITKDDSISNSLNYFDKPCIDDDCLESLENLTYLRLSYENVYSSIEDYILNINTNPLFEDLRNARAEDRKNGYLDSEKYLVHIKAFFQNGDISELYNAFSEYDLWTYDSSNLLK